MTEAVITQAAVSTGTLSGSLANSPLFGEICDWGIAAIHVVRGAGNPILETAARALSIVGDPVAYVLYMIVILWCVDERRGTRLGICLLVSNGINHAMKQTLRVPRPFTREPGINLIAETGYSLPSGHSQNSAAFWPSLGAYIGRRPLRLLLAVLPLLIGSEPVGVVVIFRLLVQKEAFDAFDLELFDLLAAHAATALMSSFRYQRLERKVLTLQGLLDLFKTGVTDGDG